MSKKRRIPRYLREAMKQRIDDAVFIPEHAIAADLTQQAPNNSYSARLYYVDVPFTCRDCGQQEVWTAAQQQWWYEVAKGSIYSGAVRCRACRQRRKPRPTP